MIRKKILLAAASSVLTFIVVFLAAEVYLRYRSGPVPSYDAGLELYTHDNRKASPLTGSLKFSMDPFTVYKNLPSQRTTSLTINSAGLRAEEGAERDSLPKIAFLGGSAAFGFGLATNQDTIASIMEQSMKSHRVLNAGVIGFLSGQELTFLVTQLIEYRPTGVVAYDGWNDLFDTVYVSQRDAKELGFNNVFFAIENQLAEKQQTDTSAFKSLSRFMRVASHKSLVLDRFAQAWFKEPWTQPSPNRKLLDPTVENYVASLRKMSLFSHAAGAEFIVVFQPELGQKTYRTSDEQQLLKIGVGPLSNYENQFPDLYREFLTKAKSLLTREGIEWMDINESVVFQNSRDSLFMDVVHTNRRGNEIIAGLISTRLQRLLMSRDKVAPRRAANAKRSVETAGTK